MSNKTMIPKARGSNLVCELIPHEDHTTDGGIVLQEQQPTPLFRVLSVGPGPLTDHADGFRVPMGYEEGDIIVASRQSTVVVGGSVFAVVAETSVLMVVEEKEVNLVQGVSFNLAPGSQRH
jgi:co-chaperonin GroES (HSP10)